MINLLQVVAYLKRIESFNKFAMKVSELLYMHDENKGQQFGYISPFLSSLPSNENKQRYTELAQMLNDAGYRWEASQGVWKGDSESSNYTIENSFLVYKISFQELMDMAKHFKQQAIIYKPSDGPIAMYDLNSSTAVVMTKFYINQNEWDAIRPQDMKWYDKQYEKGEKVPEYNDLYLQPPASTRFRDTVLKYAFNFDDPIYYTDSPITYAWLSQLAIDNIQEIAIQVGEDDPEVEETLFSLEV